jgi:hypothetical protein
MKGPPDACERKGWSLLSMMDGAMLVARAPADEDQAAKVIDSALERALESVGEWIGQQKHGCSAFSHDAAAAVYTRANSGIVPVDKNGEA